MFSDAQDQGMPTPRFDGLSLARPTCDLSHFTVRMTASYYDFTTSVCIRFVQRSSFRSKSNM
eukprot:1187776-Prorocentrum_minimum.AAC.5